MRKCVVVGDADINNYDYIKTKITENYSLSRYRKNSKETQK